MRFWDASAVVPLLVSEQTTAALMALLESDPVMLVWWGTPVECTSALARREREGMASGADVARAHGRLRLVTTSWQEVLPADAVRATAQRLLRVHPLRAADSLQLAAAIVASEHEPASLEFVSLDDRLNEAAGREGFPVLQTVGETRVAGIEPATCSLAKGSPIKLRVVGSNLGSMVHVRVKKAGQEIMGTGVVSSPISIVCDIAVDANTPNGTWDVVVDDGASTSAMLKGALTIGP